MIELFKTYCQLPNESIGEVCKKLIDNKWLVCNTTGWWICDTTWILENKCQQ